MRLRRSATLLAALTLLSQPALAQTTSTQADDARRGILTRSPQTRIDKIDHERLVVRRIDVVDERGVIRAVLAADAPAPIVDGIQYKRTFPVAGLLLFDRDGSERGGYAVADTEGTTTVAAQDHANGDAIGWRVMPDGTVHFQLNQRAPLRRDAALDNRLAVAAGAQRILMSVEADGTPAIALADKQSRPRVRLTVTSEGFGAIEFLDAQGQVLQTIAPEAQLSAKSAP